MDILTDYQLINNDKGQPLFVVIPYADFQRIQEYLEDDKLIVPDKVVGLHIMEGKTLLRAWREYKGLNLNDMSERMRILPSEYSELERQDSLSPQISEFAAKALGIDSRLLSL